MIMVAMARFEGRRYDRLDLIRAKIPFLKPKCGSSAKPAERLERFWAGWTDGPAR
jgi:hypothetical protein